MCNVLLLREFRFKLLWVTCTPSSVFVWIKCFNLERKSRKWDIPAPRQQLLLVKLFLTIRPQTLSKGGSGKYFTNYAERKNKKAYY